MDPNLLERLARLGSPDREALTASLGGHARLAHHQDNAARNLDDYAVNRQLRTGASDETLAQLVLALRDQARLCVISEEDETREPRIICSLGLAPDRTAE